MLEINVLAGDLPQATERRAANPSQTERVAVSTT
jgi:hypothetical protein